MVKNHDYTSHWFIGNKKFPRFNSSLVALQQDGSDEGKPLGWWEGDEAEEGAAEQ